MNVIMQLGGFASPDEQEVLGRFKTACPPRDSSPVLQNSEVPLQQEYPYLMETATCFLLLELKRQERYR